VAVSVVDVSRISGPVSYTYTLCHSRIYNQVCALSVCIDSHPCRAPQTSDWVDLPLGPHGIAMLGDSKSRTNSAACIYRVYAVAVST